MSNPKITHRWIWNVSEERSGIRADRALVDALRAHEGIWKPEPLDSESLSRSRIQTLIDEGHVVRFGARLEANEKLRTGDVIEIEIPEPRSLDLSPERRDDIEILFEDEHLIVVNKPQRLSVHPSDTEPGGTLVNFLLHHIPNLSAIGGVERPGIVHRIDKNTSGALVVAKSEIAHQRLVETFAKHEIIRRYWAICYGSLKGEPGKIVRHESLIARDPKDRLRMTTQIKEGRKAISFFRTLETFQSAKSGNPYASLIEARLETGRTHQVRVHLTALGASIMGDPLYGTPSERATKWLALPEEVRKQVQKLPGQALHARRLGFRHPLTGKELSFEAEPPSEFLELMRKLKGDSTSIDSSTVGKPQKR